MFDELRMYKNEDHFFLKKGDLLSVASKDVPDMPGVYYVIKLAQDRIELVYIGKSGMINEDDPTKSQLLRSSIIKRQLFFAQKFLDENIEGLDIYWVVTFDHKNKDLPSFVEGQIMQRFFDQNRRLPKWNKGD